jgi:hypothetical protein
MLATPKSSTSRAMVSAIFVAPMAVSVSLDNGNDSRFRANFFAHRSQVVANRGEVNFRPCAEIIGGNHLCERVVVRLSRSTAPPGTLSMI